MLSDLKGQLESFATNASQSQRRNLRRWEEYVFQYQGQEAKGRRYILVNAMCNTFGNKDLESALVLVLDGGTCFFNLKYDPERRQYYDLSINGDA